MVRCTCDLKACGSDDNGNLPTNCSKEVSIAGTTCDDALFQTCKTRPDMTGFCEREALTPGRSVVCWTQSDGTHRCRCPENEAQIVASSEKTCDTALRVACASECGNSDGECKRTGDGYRCSCTAGISGTAPDYLCEDALRRWCAPACESAKGKCWVRPDGTDGADCRCAGSSTLTHVARADVSADSDACRGPLVKACGQ